MLAGRHKDHRKLSPQKKLQIKINSDNAAGNFVLQFFLI